MKELTRQEINLVLDKIRSKYDKLIIEYNKPVSLKNAFEDRYILTLKLRRSLTVFLMAEIEAVEEIYKNEGIKKAELQKKSSQKKQPSFADQVLEQNKKKYSQYTRLTIHPDADEEIEYLSGAVRSFLNEHLPAISSIINSLNNTPLSIKINRVYNDFTEHIAYSGDIPLLKHYKSSLSTHTDMNKIMLEYRKAIQDAGFLLNTSMSVLNDAKTYLSSSPAGKTKAARTQAAVALSKSAIYKQYLDTDLESIINHSITRLSQIIADFRLRDIKKV